MFDQKDAEFAIELMKSGVSEQEAFDTVKRQKEESFEFVEPKQAVDKRPIGDFVNKTNQFLESSSNPVLNNPFTKGAAGLLGGIASGSEKLVRGAAGAASNIGEAGADIVVDFLPENLKKGIQGFVDENVGQGTRDVISGIDQAMGSDRNIQQNALDIGEGFLESVGTTIAAGTAPIAVGALSFGSATDTGSEILQEKVMPVLGKAGEYINMIPGLKQFKDSLPLEDQKRFDMFIAETALSLAGGLKGKRNLVKGKVSPKEFIKQNFSEGSLIKNFQENLIGLEKKGLNVGSKLVTEAPGIALEGTAAGLEMAADIPGNRRANAGIKNEAKAESSLERIIQSADIKDIENAKTTFDLINRENIDFSDRGESLLGELDRVNEDLLKTQNKDLDARRKKFVNEDFTETIGEGEFAESRNFVNESVELLGETLEKATSKTEIKDKIAVKEIAKSLEDGIGIKDVNKLARLINKYENNFTGKGALKDSRKAAITEGLRSNLKSFIEGADSKGTIRKLDKQMSSVIKTRNLLEKAVKSAQSIDVSLNQPGLKETVGSTLRDVGNFNVGNIVSRVYEAVLGGTSNKRLNKLQVMENLQKNIVDYDKALKKFNESKNKKADSAVVIKLRDAAKALRDMSNKFGKVRLTTAGDDTVK